MTHKNPRTGRYDDDLMAGLRDGSATVGDVIAHAQEILVEAPAVWGTVVTEPVKILLEVIDVLASGTPVHQHDRVSFLREQLRG